MKINWIIIGIVAIGVTALILFIIKQNRKDEKELTNSLNEEHTIADDDKTEIDNDEN